MTDLAAAYQRLPGNMRGALWVPASALSFTVMSLLVRYLGESYSPAVQTFYRQAAGLAVLAPVILRDPRGAYRTKRVGLMLFRSVAGVLALTLAFYSFQTMPLA